VDGARAWQVASVAGAVTSIALGSALLARPSTDPAPPIQLELVAQEQLTDLAEGRRLANGVWGEHLVPEPPPRLLASVDEPVIVEPDNDVITAAASLDSDDDAGPTPTPAGGGDGATSGSTSSGSTSGTTSTGTTGGSSTGGSSTGTSSGSSTNPTTQPSTPPRSPTPAPTPSGSNDPDSIDSPNSVDSDD
jgi:hypothetical protein